MTRLNQLVALETRIKSEAQRALENARQKLRQDTNAAGLPAQMAGIARTYQPRDEEGDPLPPESTLVQVNVVQVIAELRPALRRLIDLVVSKETANMQAAADIVVDGETVLAHVPVTVMLFLERQLDELRSLVMSLPVLDPAEVWDADSPGIYRTRERQTVRTVKLPKAFELSPATDKHPAQVQAYSEDKPVGDWTTVKFSGAIPAAGKAALLDRIRRLHQAVLTAREEANGMQVPDAVQPAAGEAVLGYVFGAD